MCLIMCVRCGYSGWTYFEDGMRRFVGGDGWWYSMFINNPNMFFFINQYRIYNDIWKKNMLLESSLIIYLLTVLNSRTCVIYLGRTNARVNPWLTRCHSPVPLTSRSKLVELSTRNAITHQLTANNDVAKGFAAKHASQDNPLFVCSFIFHNVNLYTYHVRVWQNSREQFANIWMRVYMNARAYKQEFCFLFWFMSYLLYFILVAIVLTAAQRYPGRPGFGVWMPYRWRQMAANHVQNGPVG